jgi:hypothetical protein
VPVWPVPRSHLPMYSLYQVLLSALGGVADVSQNFVLGYESTCRGYLLLVWYMGFTLAWSSDVSMLNNAVWVVRCW